MGNRIRQLRKERHMTQLQLSIKLGLMQETISRYENGGHYPSVTSLLAMSQLFHASCDYILGLSDCRTAGASPLSEEEQALLANYRSLPEHRQELLQAYLQGLTEE